MTRLDQEMLEALRVYDRSMARDPQWGQDFFGIDPFYIALGTNLPSHLDNHLLNVQLTDLCSPPCRLSDGEPRPVGLRHGGGNHRRQRPAAPQGTEAAEAGAAGGLPGRGQDQLGGGAGQGLREPPGSDQPVGANGNTNADLFQMLTYTILRLQTIENKNSVKKTHSIFFFFNWFSLIATLILFFKPFHNTTPRI